MTARAAARAVLLAAALAPVAAPIAAPAQDRSPSRPMDAALRAAVAAGDFPGLHAVVALRGDEVLAEAYFPGEDEAWGRPLGPVDHGPDTLHDLRSVTKSVVGLLYGAALAEGLVPPPDAPLYPAFPTYPALAADPARAGIRVEHALSMTLGLEWDERPPYADPRNSEIAMERAADRIGHVLSRPVVAPPGTTWTYSGGATALLGRLIEQGAGMDLEAFAAARLFRPLGIARWEWARGADGAVSAASGLRLRARDLARIGEMIRDDGMWAGRRVIPSDWLAASFRPRIPLGELAYGWHWYMPDAPEPAFAFGFGNGGQRLSVNRARGLVLVVFAGRYDDPEAWRLPLAISRDVLSPALDAP